MKTSSPIAIFLAATTVLATNGLNANFSKAEEMGGLKEWTTDQDIDAESKLDSDAKAAKKKAKEEDICIPIGEGENCW